MSTSSRLCSRGLTLSNWRVNTSKARATSTSTSIARFRVVCSAAVCISGPLLLAALGDLLEVAQRLGPEPLQLLAHRAQAVGARPVDPAAPLAATHDQVGLDQHLQVLRHGGPAHRHPLRDL